MTIWSTEHGQSGQAYASCGCPKNAEQLSAFEFEIHTPQSFSNGGSRPSKLEFVRACAIGRDALASTFMRAKTTTEMTTLFRFAKTVAFLRRLFPGRSFVRLLIVAVLSGEMRTLPARSPGRMESSRYFPPSTAIAA